jgi:hypothetical protein
MGRAEIVARPGASQQWMVIARQMIERYLGDLDPGYFDRTAPYPRWLVRIVPDTMTTWRGGGWARFYTEWSSRQKRSAISRFSRSDCSAARHMATLLRASSRRARRAARQTP